MIPAADTQRPEPPKYLSSKEKKIFQSLIGDAQRASLTPMLIDAHLYAKISCMELMLETEREPEQFLRIMKTLLTCYQAAGMTEIARRRLGIRPEPKKNGTIASILEARRSH